MKTKVFVQILILAIIGSAAVQAQENINRKVRKEMKKAKREIRNAKKEMKKSMKDADWEAIVIDEDGFHKFKDGHNWVELESLDHLNDKLDHLNDIIIDLDDNIIHLDRLKELEDLEDIIELDHLDDIYEMEDLDEAFEFDFDYEFEMPEMPELLFKTPKLDVRAPRVYNYSYSTPASGSVLELSKDLDNVSISKDFYFEVDKGASKMEFDIEGTLNQGDLKIVVKNPKGDVFQEFQVSPLADVNWNQQLNLDEENGTFEGKWTVTLSGSGATGNYNIRIKSK